MKLLIRNFVDLKLVKLHQCFKHPSDSYIMIVIDEFPYFSLLSSRLLRRQEHRRLRGFRRFFQPTPHQQHQHFPHLQVELLLVPDRQERLRLLLLHLLRCLELQQVLQQCR